MKRICAVALIGALLVLHGSGLAAPAGIRREASGAQTGDEGAVTAGVPQGYTHGGGKGRAVSGYRPGNSQHRGAG